MFFRKKKNKYTPPADNKYKLGEYVHFRYRDELFFGYVFYIYKDANNNTLYDVQVGGQCPAIIKGLKEDQLFIIKE